MRRDVEKAEVRTQFAKPWSGLALALQREVSFDI